MFTTFSHWFSKLLRISFGVTKLIFAVWLSLFSTAEGLGASAEEYDPVAVALLEKIKKENISPRFPFLWYGSDYSRWQGVTWSDERPRRLKALTLPYADYDKNQGPIFHQRESKYIHINDIAGLERLTFNIGTTEFKIHDLPDLQVLDLAGGKQLSLESLAGLPNLRELDLSWRFQDNVLFDPTKLHHLSVLKNLQSLKLASTEFSKPGLKEVLEVFSEVLKSLPELKELDLRGHNLTSLNFLENLPLTGLNLRKNSIRSLAGLETLTELRNLELNLNFTPLEETSGLSSLAKLESLDISERANEVWTLAAGRHPRMIIIPDLSALTGLKRLSLGPVYYPIEENLATLTNLEELHLDLCDLPNTKDGSSKGKSQRGINKFGSLIGLKNLKWLDVSCLGDLRYEYLPLLEHLDRLELKRWCLHHSGRLGHSDDSLNLEFISRLKNIKQLSLQRYFLDGSGFTGLDNLAGLDSLIDLDLSRNHIPVTMGLKDMKSLTRLNLSRNRLLRLDGLADLVTLEELDLMGNLLSDLNWEEMPTQIRRLNIGSNMFYRIDKLAKLSRLEELNISNNPLVDFSGLGEASANLKSLNLSKTKFADITLLRKFQHLEVLNLEECEISGPVDLSYWPNLKQLNIKNNRIASISGWENLPEGAVIDVSCNRLPLSLLFQLQEDSNISGRQWRVGWRCGFSRMSIQFSQWDVFDPKEVKVGEVYDLSREAVFGEVKTRFRVGEPYENSETKRRNNFPGVVNLTRLNAENPSKSGPDQFGEVCTEEQGRFVFNKPGRYIIVMENSRIGYDSYRGIEVGTSSITVK